MKREFIVVCLGSSLLYIVVNSNTFGLTLYYSSVGMSLSQVGLVLGFDAIGGAVGALVGGRLSDRYGRKPFLIVGALGFGIAYYLIYLFPTFWPIIGVRFVGGALGTFAVLMPINMIGDSFHAGALGKMLGTYQGIISVARVIGPLIVGLVINSGGFGTYLLMSFAILVSAAVLYFFSRETAPRRVSAASYPEKNEKKEKGALRNLLGLKTGVPFFLAVSGRAIGIALLTTIFPIFLAQRFSMPSFEISIFYSLLSATGIIVSPLAGILSDRIGRVRVLVLAYAIYSIVLVTYTLVSASFEALIVRFVESIGQSMILPTEQALLFDMVAASNRGLGSGVYLFSTSVELGTGYIGGGSIADLYGLNSVFYSASVFLLFAVIVISRVRPTREEPSLAMIDSDTR